MEKASSNLAAQDVTSWTPLKRPSSLKTDAFYLDQDVDYHEEAFHDEEPDEDSSHYNKLNEDYPDQGEEAFATYLDARR